MQKMMVVCDYCGESIEDDGWTQFKVDRQRVKRFPFPGEEPVDEWVFEMDLHPECADRLWMRLRKECKSDYLRQTRMELIIK